MSYAAKLIPLHLLLLSSTETTLIHELWEFLLHQLVDLVDCLLKTFFGRARDMQVERRVLDY